MRAAGLIGVAMVCVALSIATAAQQHHPPSAPDHMEHRFDDPERYAKSFDDPARDAWQLPGRVIEALALSPTASVADIGAGTGYFSVRIAKALPRSTVFAVDVEPTMVDYIRKRAVEDGLTNVVPVLAGATTPNLPKPVDLALIVDTYHHLPNRAVYFRDLKKSLAPGGRVAVVDFRKDSPDGPPPEFRFDADQIVAEMARAGYRLDRKHDFLPRQHFLIFRPEPAR
jgi:SAM-dependent methyltransferase